MLLSHLPVTSFMKESKFTDKLSCHIPVCPFSLIICSFCSFDEHVTNTDMRSINTSSMKVIFWGDFICLFISFVGVLLLFVLFCGFFFFFNLISSQFLGQFCDCNFLG